MFIKQGQCRDVRAQRRDVPEGLFANVATFQKGEIVMSRRSREWCQLMSRRYREGSKKG